jgi:hypothetical protein
MNYIVAKIIHMNLAVKFNLLKDTQPHYSYKPESCLENDNYKLYFDRTVLTDIHIQHNRPDIIILSKQQKQAYLLDIAVPNSHNKYNTDIPGHFFNSEHRPYLFPMFNFKKHRSMLCELLCNQLYRTPEILK